MPARRYLISGRVQGVGFRYFTYREATGLGIVGWVRNLPGGEVELHAEGDASVLQELEKRVSKGPSFAWVADLNVKVVDEKPFAGFEIRR